MILEKLIALLEKYWYFKNANSYIYLENIGTFLVSILFRYLCKLSILFRYLNYQYFLCINTFWESKVSIKYQKNQYFSSMKNVNTFSNYQKSINILQWPDFSFFFKYWKYQNISNIKGINAFPVSKVSIFLKY